MMHASAPCMHQPYMMHAWAINDKWFLHMPRTLSLRSDAEPSEYYAFTHKAYLRNPHCRDLCRYIKGLCCLVPVISMSLDTCILQYPSKHPHICPWCIFNGTQRGVLAFCSITQGHMEFPQHASWCNRGSTLAHLRCAQKKWCNPPYCSRSST